MLGECTRGVLVGALSLFFGVVSVRVYVCC
jgi:hypothetical protein